MSVKPIAVLEARSCRIAQGSHGAPFVQLWDDTVNDWVAARALPARFHEVEELLARYAARAATAERQLKEATKQLKAYQDGFASRGQEIAALRETRDRLMELAGT